VTTTTSSTLLVLRASGETYKVTKAGLGPADTNVVLCTLSRECLCVLARSATPYQISWNATLNHREEGAYEFKHGDYYYLLYSELVRAFLAVVESSVPGDLVGSCAANFEGSVHRDLPANENYNRIDPAWISIGGKNYMNFGSFWGDIFLEPWSVQLPGSIVLDVATPICEF
jgi:hypothetical protein